MKTRLNILIYKHIERFKIVSNRFIFCLTCCISVIHKPQIVSLNETISFHFVKRLTSCKCTIFQLIIKEAKRFETILKRCGNQYIKAFTRFLALKKSFQFYKPLNV
jgi:hypothetical protein